MGCRLRIPSERPARQKQLARRIRLDFSKTRKIPGEDAVRRRPAAPRPPALPLPDWQRGRWQRVAQTATLTISSQASIGSSPFGEIPRMSAHHRISASKVGDVTVVKFVDKKILDEASIQELGAELFGLVEHDNRKSILLNFTDVEFLSSAALGKLITLDRKVKAAKGRLKMSNIRPEIFEVFQITKLNKVFDIRSDEAEAISAF
jgi:anti-sigma B factor antagonist